MRGLVRMTKGLVRYKFNAIAGRYLDTETGRYESLSSFRRRQQRLTAQLRRELLVQTRRFQSGRMTLSEWQRACEQAIRNGHRNAAVLAAGGEERFTRDHQNAVDGLLAEEFDYLHRFAGDVRSGRKGMPILLRIAKYSTALSLSYSMSELITKKKDGWRKAMRSLDPQARHCRHCPGYATQGWIGIDAIVPRGWQCDCRNACRCTVRYRRA